jgi:hypothetical protein
MNKNDIVVALHKLVQESKEIPTSRAAREYLTDGIDKVIREIETDLDNPLLLREFTVGFNVDELEVMKKLNPIERRLVVINDQINNAINELNEMKFKIGVEVNE